MKYGQNESTRDDEKACGTTRFSQYCSTPGMFKLREQGTGGNDKGLNDDVLRIWGKSMKYDKGCSILLCWRFLSGQLRGYISQLLRQKWSANRTRRPFRTRNTQCKEGFGRTIGVRSLSTTQVNRNMHGSASFQRTNANSCMHEDPRRFYRAKIAYLGDRQWNSMVWY